ncbi:flagellar protein FliT [Hydrogenophaga aquatica]
MTTSLLTQYQTIERTSERMLLAARQSNWHEVSRLEEVCGEQVQRARELARSATLSPAEKASKQRIMLSILRHEAQIRSLAEPWMSGLSHILCPGTDAMRH